MHVPHILNRARALTGWRVSTTVLNHNWHFLPCVPVAKRTCCVIYVFLSFFLESYIHPLTARVWEIGLKHLSAVNLTWYIYGKLRRVRWLVVLSIERCDSNIIDMNCVLQDRLRAVVVDLLRVSGIDPASNPSATKQKQGGPKRTHVRMRTGEFGYLFTNITQATPIATSKKSKEWHYLITVITGE